MSNTTRSVGLTSAKRQDPSARAVFVIEVCDKPAGEKYSKRTCQPDLAILQTDCAKRLGHETCVGHSMEFTICPRREPICFQLAGFARTQTAHRTIDLCFHIKGRSAFGCIAHRRHTVAAQPQLRAIRPKNNGSLPGIGFEFLVSKTLDHGIAAVAIDDRQPTISRIYPKLGRQVGIVQRK